MNFNFHTCNFASSGSNSDQIRLRICRRFRDATAMNGDVEECCETNRFGYFGNDLMATGTYTKLDGNKPLLNGNYDDGGDKLGQCEGFELNGPRVYLTGKNM